MPKDLRNVDLNLIVAFAALMEGRSVTAAAERLSVGQSAMSSTLSRLRALFDDPLLERVGRAMVPTARAESLNLPVLDALRRVDYILSARPEFDPSTERRTFTVMASEYAALAVLQPLTVHLRSTAPNIALRIIQTKPDFVADLERGDVDMVVIPIDFDPQKGPFARQRLYDDPFVVAVDAVNPDMHDSMSLEQFSSTPYLAAQNGPFRTLVEDQLDNLGVERQLEATTGFGIAPLLLRDTPMMTLLPLSFAMSIADGARLKLLLPPMPLQPLTETLFWADRRTTDPGHRWLRELIAEVSISIKHTDDLRKS